MEVAYSIKEKVTEYFNDIPDLKGQEPSKLLIDFVIENISSKGTFLSILLKIRLKMIFKDI